MSKFDQISTFISVVDENGFAAAARKKQISTAAVSRQVALLESDLGVNLLHRTTRQLSLTDVGMLYYQQCKKILSELVETEQLISASQEEVSGDLYVMTNRYFYMTHLLPKLPEFLNQHPKLRVHFQLAEQFPNLENDGIDILFGVSVEGSHDLIRRRIATTRYVLCATPTYLEKYGIPVTPKELVGHSYITHSLRQPNNTIKFINNIEIHMTPLLWLNDSYAMRESALDNLGIVNLHDYMVTEYLNAGLLTEILKQYQEPHTNIYLYYRQSRYLQPKIRQFIDFYTL